MKAQRSRNLLAISRRPYQSSFERISYLKSSSTPRMVRRQASRSTVVEIALARPHVIMHQPALAAVDRIHHAGAARVDGAGAPGAFAFAGDRSVRARGYRSTARAGSTASPDSSAPIALRTTERAPSQPIRIAAIHDVVTAPVSRSRRLARAELSSTTTSSTEVRLTMRMRGCAAACSNRIGSRKIWLMRCGGSGVGQLQSGPSVAVKRSLPAGNMDSRQLLPGERSAVADVVRIIRRQSGVADFFGDAEPPEDFHGAGGDVVAFRLRRRGAGCASPPPSRRCRATRGRSRA